MVASFSAQVRHAVTLMALQHYYPWSLGLMPSSRTVVVRLLYKCGRQNRLHHSLSLYLGILLNRNLSTLGFLHYTLADYLSAVANGVGSAIHGQCLMHISPKTTTIQV